MSPMNVRLRQPVFSGSVYRDPDWHHGLSVQEIADGLVKNIETETKLLHAILPSVLEDTHREDCTYAIRITIVQELEGDDECPTENPTHTSFRSTETP